MTTTANKQMAAGQEAAREKHISAKKGTHVFADDEDEAMVEESFSVGGSVIDEEVISQNQMITDEDHGNSKRGYWYV